MSGLEIAGIVLRAFRVAISALETYRGIAEDLDRFHKIRLEYKKWRDDLEFYKLAFTANLRQLLLPLVADDEKIREPLLSPGGDCWRDESVAVLFEKRLQESYELYMQYIQGIRRVLDEINRVLAVDSEWTQRLLDSSQQTPNKRMKVKKFFFEDGFKHQIRKFKLSSKDAARKRLFDELQGYNDKLETLLKASDEDVRLVNYRKSRQQSENIDMAICGFWKKARSVFQALASAWICQCQQHGAKLLLQHRTAGKVEFDLILTGFIPSRWGVHRIRVSEGDDMIAARLKESVTTLENIPNRHPSHRQSYPTRSALRTSVSTEASTKLQRPPPLVTLTCVNTMPLLTITQEISNLCTLFELPERSCYGYLTNEDCRYYVYDISQHSTDAMLSVTLDQILRGEICPLFTRSQRYTLSLIIASTYLQLLDSPWLPSSPKRVDIHFLRDNEDTALIKLDQPHISQDFTCSLKKDTSGSVEKHPRFANVLDHLGIMLLELCFGRIIDEQPWRKELPAGENDKEKAGFDVLAAREWQCHVNEEAGEDYADAVSWCLGGNRSAPPEKWRQEMLRKVIQPLQRSRDYLANGGTGL